MSEIKVPLPPNETPPYGTLDENHGSVAVTAASENLPTSTPPVKNPKQLCDAYILWFPFGLLGFHHFYLRRWAWGFAYLFSLGLFGIGWMIDGCRMKSLVQETNEKLLLSRDPERSNIEQIKQKSLGDAYVLCLSPITGLLGFHNYYLGRIGFGLLYTFTLGCFGIGWICDVFRMTCLVKRVNKQLIEGKDRMKHLDDAYVCLFPLGIIGLHNYYLGRPCWGLLYTFTLGCLGIGWIIDWFRLPYLVKMRNQQIEQAEQNTPVLTDSNISGPPSFVVTKDTTIYPHNPGQMPPYPGYGTPTMPVPSYMNPSDQPPSYEVATQNPPPRPPPPHIAPDPNLYPKTPYPIAGAAVPTATNSDRVSCVVDEKKKSMNPPDVNEKAEKSKPK